MKEKHNEKNIAHVKVRARKRFFLYSDGNGLLKLDEAGKPNFDHGDVVVYESRSKAAFARDFFTSVKAADSLDILTKVA